MKKTIPEGPGTPINALGLGLGRAKLNRVRFLVPKALHAKTEAFCHFPTQDKTPTRSVREGK